MAVQSFSTLQFFVNGHKISDDNVNPEWTLLYYLRNKLRLCGTKLGCAEGGCGACTVMISKFDRVNKKVIHLAVNACLTPVCAMHGLAVTTVEGIGSIRTKLHAVQERIAKAHGTQCGFCTPGIVMSMYTLLRSHLFTKPTIEEIEIALQGNLCRCTGYRPILEGYRTFTEEWEQHRYLVQNLRTCNMGEQCCKKQYKTIKNNKSNITDCNATFDQNENVYLFNSEEFTPYDPTQEPIFPPELMISSVIDNQYLLIKGPRVTWHRPTSLKTLLHLKSEFPEAKIINGNTEVGLEIKFKGCVYPTIFCPTQVTEMVSVSITADGLKVGASVTLTDLETNLEEQITKLPKFKTSIFKSILEMLKWFSSKQIRNTGTVGGNIMTGSPISDLNPIFMAANCTLELESCDAGSRFVKMDELFWTGYRQNIVQPNEILIAILIPFSEKDQYFQSYKQAKRRVDDIAIVNAAFNLQLEGLKIKVIKIAYGGMGATTILANKTTSKLSGMKWDEQMVNLAYVELLKELPLDPGAPGGEIKYRHSLTLGFFLKFYLLISDVLEKLGHQKTEPFEMYENIGPKCSQYYTIVPSTQEKHDLVGRPIVHKSAFQHSTGEAIYCDDIPKFENELYMAFVLSSHAHAKILSIDASKALEIPGVIEFFSSQHNFPLINKFGMSTQDDEIFANGEVKCCGQIIGAIVGNDQLLAKRAAKLVEVQYEDIKPTIISIEDAIQKNSYYLEKPKVLTFGDTEKAFSEEKNIIEGELKVGGQEHFYLETHSSIAVPKGEDGEMEIFCSTQHPAAIQAFVARALGIPLNKVTCRVKRIGGGFGGKESRGTVIALPVAVAAYKLQRPVRVMLDRDEDMLVSGQRHAFRGNYKVAFSSKGKILACELHLYINAGYTLDLSEAVIDRIMINFQNSYYIPNVTCYGYICKTNAPSNTVFRGTGAPQAMLLGETIVRHVAETLSKDIIELTEMNLYKEGDSTQYYQKLEHCTIHKCWSQCKNDSSYEERKSCITDFNKENKWKKRGIAMVPTMFGIAFGVKFMNQAGALVLIYVDGSVLISHGGVEIGQGLNTKMIQVASRALGISQSYIHISETSTDKVPNTSPTAASSSSDLNGMAVLNACNELNDRLQPIKDKIPNGTWEDWVKAAYFERISLATSSFYKTPSIGFNEETKTGNMFNYFTFGAACSEVEIDRLTGDHLVLRTDIVMDVGESMNPAIDIGQIEGAFMQGYGLYTLEELLFSPSGEMRTRGPSSYKIPTISDIPKEFNVSLLKGAPNPRAVYSSKGIGEPPLFLSSSIFFAIKEAIKSAREDEGLGGWFMLNSPATSSRIRMACEDHITKKVLEQSQSTNFEPWNVEMN